MNIPTCGGYDFGWAWSPSKGVPRPVRGALGIGVRIGIKRYS
uniref:Uncharacterized protein n=1 Tax=Setaria italica TaxID=4555 RepID=K3Y481_SETIT